MLGPRVSERGIKQLEREKRLANVLWAPQPPGQNHLAFYLTEGSGYGVQGVRVQKMQRNRQFFPYLDPEP